MLKLSWGCDNKAYLVSIVVNTIRVPHPSIDIPAIGRNVRFCTPMVRAAIVRPSISFNAISKTVIDRTTIGMTAIVWVYSVPPR